MVLPVLIVGSAVFGSLWATQAAAKALVGIELFGAKNKETILRKQQHLDINPEKDEFHKKLQENDAAVLASIGFASAVNDDEDFHVFDLPVEVLPDSLTWLAGKFMMSRREQDELFEAIATESASYSFEWAREVSARRLRAMPA